MTNQQQELLKAVEFVRRTFAERGIQLDYSIGSLKHLDQLFDDEFKNGKLKNSSGSFAKFQGMIMIGISGYLAQVILNKSSQVRLYIDQDDANWFVNFRISADDNRSLQPGLQILKRVQYGAQASLQKYVQAAIRYFNEPGSKMPEDLPAAAIAKPWWKFW